MNGKSFTPYGDIFRLLKKHPDWFFRPRNEFQHRQAAVLLSAEILVWDKANKAYMLHPKQIKPAISVVEIPPKTTPSSDLGRVHVDWSGRGHSSGSYAVKADKGKFLEIAFELDVERVMTVAKERTKAAA